jgi:hypothetical protein
MFCCWLRDAKVNEKVNEVASTLAEESRMVVDQCRLTLFSCLRSVEQRMDDSLSNLTLRSIELLSAILMSHSRHRSHETE